MPPTAIGWSVCTYLPPRSQEATAAMRQAAMAGADWERDGPRPTSGGCKRNVPAIKATSPTPDLDFDFAGSMWPGAPRHPAVVREEPRSYVVSTYREIVDLVPPPAAHSPRAHVVGGGGLTP
ncbi:hypothetical protein [Streptomyces sp. R41]|uniref:Uncharacterized protein n=1 Tax=Streptomyces sp. R41 TaxID=3238632 RepID=A0AB39RVE3_9ACTN